MSGAILSLTGRYNTPNEDPAETLCRVLRIPDDTNIIAAINEMLFTLTRPEVWTEAGITPDETCWLVADMLDNYYAEECGEGNGTEMSVPIGGIVLYAGGANPPTGFLNCYGQSLSATSYPELFAVLDDAWKYQIEGIWFINLPDLQGRFPIGANELYGYQPSDTGGEEAHTLTVDEMPAHTHTVPSSTTDFDHARTRRGRDTYPADPIATSSAGGGQPHNNMPPYQCVRYIIRYE